MSDIAKVLQAFSAAYGTGAVLWTQSATGAPDRVDWATAVASRDPARS